MYSTNIENSEVTTRMEYSDIILIPKKGKSKHYKSYSKIALISHAGKVMLKILQASL